MLDIPILVHDFFDEEADGSFVGLRNISDLISKRVIVLFLEIFFGHFCSSIDTDCGFELDIL